MGHMVCNIFDDAEVDLIYGAFAQRFARTSVNYQHQDLCIKGANNQPERYLGGST